MIWPLMLLRRLAETINSRRLTLGGREKRQPGRLAWKAGAGLAREPGPSARRPPHGIEHELLAKHHGERTDGVR